MRSRESHPRAGLSAAAPPAPPRSAPRPARGRSVWCPPFLPTTPASPMSPVGLPNAGTRSATLPSPRVWAEWSERGLHRSSGLAHSQGRLPRRRQRVGHSSDEDGPRQAMQEPRVRWEAGSEQRPLLRVPWKGRADGASRLRAVWAECRPARAQGPCCLVRPRVIRVGTVAWKAQFWAVVYSL